MSAEQEGDGDPWKLCSTCAMCGRHWGEARMRWTVGSGCREWPSLSTAGCSCASECSMRSAISAASVGPIVPGSSTDHREMEPYASEAFLTACTDAHRHKHGHLAVDGSQMQGNSSAIAVSKWHGAEIVDITCALGDKPPELPSGPERHGLCHSRCPHLRLQPNLQHNATCSMACMEIRGTSPTL